MPLPIEIVINPQLRPYKIDIEVAPIFCNLPPKPPLHQLPDQRTIVAIADPHLILLVSFNLLLPVHLAINTITPLQLKNQLSVRLYPPLVDCVLVLVADRSH